MNKAETEENETDEDVNVKAKTEESETDENVNVSNERNLVEEIVTQDEENAKVYQIQECQKKMADAKTKTQMKIKQHIRILQLILKVKMSRSTAVLVDLCSNKKIIAFLCSCYQELVFHFICFLLACIILSQDKLLVFKQLIH